MHDAGLARPGTMAAVLGLDDDQVDVACDLADADVWVANYNAPGQVVIAGSPDGVDAAGAHAKDLGAKRVMPLQVSGAFHTPFMTAGSRPPARRASQTPTPRDSDVPVVSNVDALPHDQAADWASLLSAQLSSPVRWKHCLLTLAGNGVTDFAELGPGGVLTGMAKRTVSDSRTISVATPDDLDKLLEWVGAGPASTPRQQEGEHLFAVERLVVSPAAGIFTPSLRSRDGSMIDVGTVIGHVGDIEVRSPFGGVLQSFIARRHRARHARQPIAWLRTEHDESGLNMPQVPTGIRGAVITGWGTALPDKVVTNDDLERTHGHERRVDRRAHRHRGTPRRRHHRRAVGRGRAPSARRAGLEPGDIDALVLATTTPDRAVPGTSATVQHALGSAMRRIRPQRRLFGVGVRAGQRPRADRDGRREGARDRHRHARRESPTGTTATRPSCSPTAPAPSCSRPSTAAANCSAGTSTADGSAEDALYAEVGGMLQMEGKEVFRRAVRIMVDSADAVDGHAGVTADDITLVVPHQANIRIIPASCDRLGIRLERASIVLDHTGNTSSASIPLALADALDHGRVPRATWCSSSDSEPG